MTTPRYSVPSLLVALTVAAIGCSDDSNGGSAADTSAPDSNADDVTTTSDIGTDTADDTSPLPDTLCDTLWTRAKSCGHTTTFPGFEAWCAGDGQGVREALELCKVKPCAQLVVCLDEAGAPSQGL